jgi:chromosome partitioning protein
MGIIVSMINWKGGVGKTTLTLHIGAGLAHFYEKRVLLVDLDPQCNLSYLALGAERYIQKVYKENQSTLKTIFDAYFREESVDAKQIILSKAMYKNLREIYEQVDLILSHQDLVLLDLDLARQRKTGKDLKEETRFEIAKLSILNHLLRQVKDDYDYILLDCPPNVNFVTQNAFYASDYYVIPAVPNFLSTIGISIIKAYMNKFNAEFSHMLGYTDFAQIYQITKWGGIIFNMVDEWQGKPKQTHQEVMRTTTGMQGFQSIFDRYLTSGDGISVAASVNLPVFAYDNLPRSNQNAKKQAQALQLLIDEFVTRIC